MEELNLSQYRFYKHLKNDTLPNFDLIVDFDVIIDASVINWHFRILKNITFKKKVIIRDVEINSGLSFFNCKFEKIIVFHNVKSTNYNVDENKDNCSISFDKCNSNLIAFEEDCYFDRSVNVINDCVIEKISTHKTFINNGGFKIGKSIVSYLDISNSHFGLNLSHSVFNKAVRVESLIGDISLLNNEFNDWITFWNVECRFSLSSNENVFKDKLNIESSRIKNLTIYRDHFHKKGELENRDLSGNALTTYLKEIYISETNFAEGFEFRGLGEQLDKLDVIASPELKGVLNFQGWKVDKTYITGVNQNLKLLFKSMSFRFFLINDFTNYSDMSFDKCKGDKESTFNLSDSDLGATKFNEFMFDSFGAIRIDNATLDKIKPTANTWFEDKVLQVGNGTQTKQEEFKSKREIYRQIKQALKNNGNQIDSLVFQAKELSAFRNEQKNSANYDWADRLIMSVSQANDYGLNWKKPAKIVFGVTFFLYIILLPYLSDKISYEFAFCPDDLKNTWQAFLSKSNVLWQLFNPIRQMKVTYGDNVSNGWIYFIDLIHRIFLGIMIFQIVKAFRKFVSS
ncbi:hypothetical protein [Flavobacterium pectinovorum]|uniref:hypothetical protein n=1 Tax=Flavobacterium pectinovorum TaxID=29533 RepID=UPI001FAD7010|nr:hypothetical protein [Flavobacterium pectinovorum]MCI9845687.1 hypothetical protein [Flavobacterium pectinovorum]